MRYSVFSESLTVQQVEAECRKVGAANIRVMRLVRQVICDLEPSMVARLTSANFKVKPVKGVAASAVQLPVALPTRVEASGLDVVEVFSPLRDYFDPPLTGVGLTVAVIDSGIRATHEAIKDRVVYSVNLSGGPNGDIFNHGTNTASIIVGISPGVHLMDIKVLGSDGTGTEEQAIDGIEEVIELVEEAENEGRSPTDALYPNVMNMSFGEEDDGDYDNALRAACRVAVDEYGLEAIAAAGNGGPNLSTVTVPAVDASVIAVGGMETDRLEVWEQSSRGPSLDGQIKPDFVIWAIDVQVASSKGDQEYLSKSGTSFSTPILSGARGLLSEMAKRVKGPGYDITWRDIQALAPLFCVKAEDAPIRKDNDWGYGFPVFGRIASNVMGAAPAGIDIISLMPVMIMIPLMGMMMKMGK